MNRLHFVRKDFCVELPAGFTWSFIDIFHSICQSSQSDHAKSENKYQNETKGVFSGRCHCMKTR